MTDKAIVTCALTGVLTNPKQHPVPVTPEEMAAAAKQAYDAGAAAPVVLAATSERALEVIPIDLLEEHSVDVPGDASSLG